VWPSAICTGSRFEEVSAVSVSSSSTKRGWRAHSRGRDGAGAGRMRRGGLFLSLSLSLSLSATRMPEVWSCGVVVKANAHMRRRSRGMGR